MQEIKKLIVLLINFQFLIFTFCTQESLQTRLIMSVACKY